MPDITNAQALDFVVRARQTADALECAYETARRLMDEWNATGMSTLIPNTTDRVRDGADPTFGTADGRKPVTGAKVTAIVTRCQEKLADYQATSNAKLNTVKLVSVNGGPKF